MARQRRRPWPAPRRSSTRRARRADAGRSRALAYSERRRPLVGYRVAADDRSPAERHANDAGLVGDELLPDDAGQRLPVPPRASGRSATSIPASGDEVALPSGPHDGVALPHQEAVAGVGNAQRIGGTRGIVERPQSRPVATVVDVVQDPLAAARQVDRLQDVDVAGELNESTTVARSVVQVDDVGVMRASAGSRAKPTRPVKRSYGPASPNGRPSANTARLSSSRRTSVFIDTSFVRKLLGFLYHTPIRNTPIWNRKGVGVLPRGKGLGSAAMTTARCSVVPSPLPYSQRLSSASARPPPSGPDPEEEWLTMALNGAPWMRFLRSPS